MKHVKKIVGFVLALVMVLALSAGVFAEIFRLNAEKYHELHGIQWEWQAMDGALVQAPVRGQPMSFFTSGTPMP